MHLRNFEPFPPLDDRHLTMGSSLEYSRGPSVGGEPTMARGAANQQGQAQDEPGGPWLPLSALVAATPRASGALPSPRGFLVED